MSRIKEIIEFNEKFVDDKNYIPYLTSKIPEKKIVILSCMDTRLTELLPKAMNLKNGDAKIIKNAGATIMHPFGSIMRSIILAIYEFEVEDVIVVGHTGCGVSNLDTEGIINKMYKKGISKDKVNVLKYAGIDVEKWLHGFDSVEGAIAESVKAIINHPLIPNNIEVHGFIMDSVTGKLKEVN